MPEDLTKAKEPEKKPEEEEKTKADAPQWAIELGAKIDKLADAIIRSSAPVEKAKDEEEEKKPKDEKKANKYPEPDKYPKEEKAGKPEKYPYKEEEKAGKPEKYPYKEEEKEDMCPEKYSKEEKQEPDLSKMVENAVAQAMAKRFPDEDPVKRSKVISKSVVNSTISETDDMIAFNKLSWADVHARAKELGAP